MKCALDLVEGCDGDRVCGKCGGCERHCTCKTEAERAWEEWRSQEPFSIRYDKRVFFDGFEAGQKVERERILKIIHDHFGSMYCLNEIDREIEGGEDE